MMNNLNLRRMLSAMTILAGWSTATARADLVNIGAIGTITMTANTQSPSITIPIYDANTAVASNLVAWSLGLRVVPLGGATGTVTIDSTFGYPSGNLLSSPNPAGVPQSTANSPTSGDYTVGAASTGFVPVFVTRRVGTLPASSTVSVPAPNALAAVL